MKDKTDLLYAHGWTYDAESDLWAKKFCGKMQWFSQTKALQIVGVELAMKDVGIEVRYDTNR